MVVWNTPRSYCQKALLIASLLALSACGTDEDEISSLINEASAAEPIDEGDSGTDPDIENQISGSIGDGPIVGARLRVFNNSGELLHELTSDSADYDITIRTQGNNHRNRSAGGRRRIYIADSVMAC